MRVPSGGGGMCSGPSVGSGSFDRIGAGVPTVFQISRKSTPLPLSRMLGGMPSLSTTERPRSSWPVTMRRAGFDMSSPPNYRMREYSVSGRRGACSAAFETVKEQIADEVAVAGAQVAFVESLAERQPHDRHAVDEEFTHADDRQKQQGAVGAAEQALLVARFENAAIAGDRIGAQLLQDTRCCGGVHTHQ